MLQKSKYLISILAITCLSFSACSMSTPAELINQDNMQVIEEGMVLGDVEKILGKATQVIGDLEQGGHAFWLTSDEKYMINVGFENGKVMMKQWVEAE